MQTWGVIEWVLGYFDMYCTWSTAEMRSFGLDDLINSDSTACILFSQIFLAWFAGYHDNGLLSESVS
jgi:hypothetical protein